MVVTNIFFSISKKNNPKIVQKYRAAWNFLQIYVSVKSKLQHPSPWATPRHLTLLKITVQIPPCPGQNAVQMPHTRVRSGDQMPPPWGHSTGT